MIDSMLPSGVRSGNLYIGRAPYGSRPVINIAPGTFQGSARAPKGSRPAPLDTVRCPLYLLTKIGEKESRGARPYIYIYIRDIANDTALFEWRNPYILSKSTTDDFSSYDVHTNAIRHPQERLNVFLWQSAVIVRLWQQ